MGSQNKSFSTYDFKRIRFKIFQKVSSSHAVMLITLTVDMFDRLIAKMN